MDPPFYTQDLYNETGVSIGSQNFANINTVLLNVSAGSNFAYLSQNKLVGTDASDNLISYDIISSDGSIDITNTGGVIDLKTTESITDPTFNSIYLQVLGSSKTTKIYNADPTVNSNVVIPNPGLSNSKFILQDSVNAQNINSYVNFENTTRFGALSTNGVLSLNEDAELVSTELIDGQLLIGKNGVPPVAGNITGSNNIAVANGPGSIALDTVQNISQIDSPTFYGLTLTSGLTTENLPSTGSGNSHWDMKNGSNLRWRTFLQSNETGSNAGSDWCLARYNDSGTILDFALTINRSSGLTYIKSMNLLASSNQLAFGVPHGLTPPGSTTFNVATSTNGNNFINFRDVGQGSGLSDYAVFENLSQTLYDKILSKSIELKPTASDGTTPGTVYITGGNSGATNKQLIIRSNFPTNNQQLQIYYDTANDFSKIDSLLVGTGGKKLQINPSGGNIYLGSGTSNVGIDCDPIYPLDVNGTANFRNNVQVQGTEYVGANGDMKLTCNSASGYADVDVYTGSGGTLSTKVLNLNPSGGYTMVNNTNRYTSPTDSGLIGGAKMFIFGSGTNDGNSYTLHLRSNNNNTTPSSLMLGYNLTSGYSVIQSVNHFVAYTDICLNPNGGNVQVYNNVSGGKTSLATWKGNISLVSSGAVTSAFVNFTYVRRDNWVTVCWDRLSATTGSTSTLNFTGSGNVLPSYLFPAVEHRFIYYGNNNGAVGPFLAVLTTGGAFQFFGSSTGGNFTASTSMILYSGSIKYPVSF